MLLLAALIVTDLVALSGLAVKLTPLYVPNLNVKVPPLLPVMESVVLPDAEDASLCDSARSATVMLYEATCALLEVDVMVTTSLLLLAAVRSCTEENASNPLRDD